jgi:DNA helicase-2/ATP-dependent DNA helicase PcrA
MCPKLTPKALEGFNGLGELFTRLQASQENLNLPDLIEVLLKRTDYLQHLDDGTPQAEERMQNVKELESVAKEYTDMGLAGFLEEVALVSDLDNMDTGSDAVTLMTLHAAKGLEFPVVFMIGMEENVFPHSRAMYEPDEMEEERRLCYVGMTRAKQELYLSSASSRLLYGSLQHNPPSRFLADIDDKAKIAGGFDVSTPIGTPANLPESNEPQVVSEETGLKEGDLVRHSMFGNGRITAIEGANVTIAFSGGTKKLNAAFAPLEKVS